MEWIDLAEVAGTCECGDEPSGSIKCGNLLTNWEELSASQEGLCCMQLVPIHGYSKTLPCQAVLSFSEDSKSVCVSQLLVQPVPEF